jgi:hypothetical protein
MLEDEVLVFDAGAGAGAMGAKPERGRRFTGMRPREIAFIQLEQNSGNFCVNFELIIGESV